MHNNVLCFAGSQKLIKINSIIQNVANMTRFYPRIATFLFGVLLGIFIGKTCVVNEFRENSYALTKKSVPSYKTWFKLQHFKRNSILWDTLRYGKHNYVLESDFLFGRIKVLCIILLRNDRNVEAARNTWSNGCNNVHVVHINTKKKKFAAVKRSKENSSWVLLCQTLKTIPNNYDWFLIVNDNIFVILENLRYYVASLNALEKHYLGYAVKFWNTIYNSGQAGYVLSKGALKALKDSFNQKECAMNAYWNREDFYLGKLLASLNITPVDTKDMEGLSTFHPYNWYQVFFPQESYYSMGVFPNKCCSRYSITFQAIEGDKMYTYYYLLYKLQIFVNGYLGNKVVSSEIPDDQVWKSFLKERNIPSDNITSEEYYKVWEDLVHDPNSFAANMKKEVHFDYELN